MSTIHNLVAGALLLGGSLLHAQDATSSTYCEFTGSFSGLCASDAIQMTAPVVNSSSGAASFSFNISSGIFDAVNYVVPKVEVIASNSKFLDSSIFLDDPKSGVSKFIVEKVALQSPTKSAVFTFSSDNRSPYYIFYRLISKSGDFWQSTPWKIYQNGGIPVSICLHDVCGDERLSIKVADNAYINRLSISYDSLSSYNLISDDKTISLSTFSCKSDAVSAATALKSETTSCYADGNRKVFLDVSKTEDHLSKISTKITSNFGVAAFDAGILYNVLNDKSLVAAVIDQGASIDNLKDLAADMYLRYDKLASLSDILGASRTDGLGIAGRNKGWLYPRFMVKNVAENTPRLYIGVYRKIPIQAYYGGREISSGGSDGAAKNGFDINVSMSHGGGLAYRSGTTKKINDITDDMSCILSNSDVFKALLKDGFWVSATEASTLSVKVDGARFLLGSVSRSSFMKEDCSYRQYDYERISGTYSDRLYYKGVDDTAYIHCGAAKRLDVELTPGFSQKLQWVDVENAIDVENCSANGKYFTLSLAQTLDKGEMVHAQFDLEDGNGTYCVPMVIKALKGVSYVLVGYSAHTSDAFIENSRTAAVYFAKSVIDSGEEPHVISSYRRLKKGETFHSMRTTDIGDNVYGLANYEVGRCVDGKPFTARGTSTVCGGGNLMSGKNNTFRIGYFGHGLRPSGYPIFGMDNLKGFIDYHPMENGTDFGSDVFSNGAIFTMYSCDPAKIVDGGRVISRFANDMNIRVRGLDRTIFNDCLGKMNKVANACPQGYLKYFMPVDANIKNSLFGSRVLRLFDYKYPGSLKRDDKLWNQVMFLECSSSGECSAVGDKEIVPEFFRPIER